MLDQNGEKCGKLFYSECLMKSHLEHEHIAVLRVQASKEGNPLARLLVIKTEQMHLGREGHHSFWCGFCNRLVAQDKSTHPAWEERFKHIGDHYDRENRHIDDWICVQENRRRGTIDRTNRKKAKDRKDSRSVGLHTGLGESGSEEAFPFQLAGVTEPLEPLKLSRQETDLAGPSHMSHKRQRIDEADRDAEHESDDGW